MEMEITKPEFIIVDNVQMRVIFYDEDRESFVSLLNNEPWEYHILEVEKILDKDGNELQLV